jgi:RNA polymerase sigma-B factor
MALIKAIDRFDPERGVAFSTFAVPTILGELKRHFRDRGWSVHVPRAVKDLSVRLERITGELINELGRTPTPAELAARADSSLERVLEAQHAATARHPLPLHHPPPGPRTAPPRPRDRPPRPRCRSPGSSAPASSNSSRPPKRPADPDSAPGSEAGSP